MTRSGACLARRKDFMDAIKNFLNRWWVILALILLSPVFWTVAQVFAAHTDVPNSNFFKIWLAGHLVWSGADPYSPVEWVSGHLAAGSSWVPEKGFLYPLPLAYFLSPLGLLTPQTGYTVWAFLSMLGCAAAIFMLVNAWDEARLKVFSLLLLVALALFAPTLETLGKGTIGALLVFMAVCAIECFRRGKSLPGGMLLAFLLLKPQLGLPVLAGMGLWILVRRDWRGLSGMAAGALLLFLIGAAGDLYWVGKFLNVSGQKFGLAFGSQPTLFSLASLLCAGAEGCATGLGALLAFGLAGAVALLFFRKAKELSALQALSISAPMGMLVTPYLWSYDHILLLVPFTWIAYQLIRRTEKYIFAMLFLVVMDVAGGVGLVLQGASPQGDFWNFVIPLVTIGLSIWSALLPALPKPEPVPGLATPGTAREVVNP